jgi:outer membrane protein OmpA-like peptidoglycan-associated protein
LARLLACLLAVQLFLAATPASACLPPSVEFARGSAALDAIDREEIDRIANGFRQAPRGSRVELEAVEDDAGSAAVNRRMARRRAQAVRAALVGRGVPIGAIDIRISPAGNGWQRAVWMNINTNPGCV